MKPTSRVLICNCVALVGLALLIAQPAAADTFSSTLATPTASSGRCPSVLARGIETETADDFILTADHCHQSGHHHRVDSLRNPASVEYQ